jgi:DNA-binding NarL/FixJ family response regulator
LAICDDHDLVRVGLTQMLQANGQFLVSCQAGNIAELNQALQSGAMAEVVLLDLILGASCVADGLDQIKSLCADHPTMPIIVLSMHDEPEVVFSVLSAGAKGYVSKDSPPSALMDAITQVHRGHRYVAPKLVENLLLLGQTGPHQTWHASLTPREYEVLKRVVAGESIKSIALDLDLSIKTVSTHKVRLMDKLGVSNNAELIRLAMKNGMS